MADAGTPDRARAVAAEAPRRRDTAPGACGCASAERSAFACPRCRARARLNRFAAGPAPGLAPPIVNEVLGRAGTALDAGRRAAMQQRFGHDFGHVRVHHDALAQASARAVGARAYTVGQHIVFGAGASDRGDPALLAHELAHVVQQPSLQSAPAAPLAIDDVHSPAEREAERWAAAPLSRPVPARVTPSAGLRVQRQVAPSTAPAEHMLDTPDLCEGRVDVTDEVRRFAADAHDLIATMPGATDEQRRSLRETADWVLHSEGAADIDRMQVVSCTQINSELATGRETVSAYVDPGRNEVGLSERVAALMAQIRSSPTREAMTEFLQTIAHEKRHVTLGGAVDVATSALRPGRMDYVAQHATYRAEEILTTAEEIAVGRLAMGSDFIVERREQEKLYRLRNTLRGWLTEEAWLELRGRIIGELRSRYGFEGGCDNALTLGVLSSMEHNEWHSCNRERGEVTSRIPEGLNICSGASSPCPARRP